MPEFIRLADNDLQRLTLSIVAEVMRRAYRDAHRLGLVLKLDNPQAPQHTDPTLVLGCPIHQLALKLAEWAQVGRGNPAEIAACILQARADLEGIDLSEGPPSRPLDPATLPGAVLVAAGARLAVVEARTVTAVELAVLGGVDEHTVRAAVKARTLQPVAGSTRPMRFAADIARAYLYVRGVPGFAAP
jgi:hypothetical protein